MLNPETDEFEVNPFKKSPGRLEFYVAPLAHKMGVTSTQFIKWLLVIFNILFFILGLALIGAGAVAKLVYSKHLAFLDNGYSSVSGFMIFVGVVISIVSFLGCCGALKSHLCFIVTFAVFLGALFILEISGAIAAYVERNQIGSYLLHNMKITTTAQGYYTDSVVWDYTQEHLRCCGADNFKDWANNTIPASCCRSKAKIGITCVTSPEVLLGCDPPPIKDSCPIHPGGCAQELRKILEEHMGAVAGVGLAIAFIQIVGMTLSCILAKRIRSGYVYA